MQVKGPNEIYRGLMLDLDQKFDLAKLPVAGGASFDSHVEEHNGTCLENTRAELQYQIMEANHSPASSYLTVDGTLSTPFLQPTANSLPAPPKTLTPDQESKYASILSTVQSWATLPTSSGSANASRTPLSDSERLWLTRECLLRYLRASKWNETHAVSRLEATLVWR